MWYAYYTGQCGGAACAGANYYACMRMLCVREGVEIEWVELRGEEIR